MKGMTGCARDSAALNVPSRLHCHVMIRPAARLIFFNMTRI